MVRSQGDSMSLSRLLICSFLLLVSCGNNDDAKWFAERYCECMKNNNATSQYENAPKICGQQIIDQNRFFRLSAVDLSDKELSKKVSDETRDSVKSFMLVFLTYTNSHCCKETLACP